MQNKYILDSNILITPSNKYYDFEIAPSFWEQVINNGDSIILAEEVKKEIFHIDDRLSKWLKNNIESFNYIKPNSGILECYSEIVSFVDDNYENDVKKNEFFKGADGWLCAYSKFYQCPIVTFETYNPNETTSSKIKIPNICKQLDLKYIDLFEFMKRIKICM